MQNLQVGSTGSAVMELQKMLNANGANLTVDGKFGPLTQAALKNYQGANGLVPDGIYGPKTAAVLNPPKTTTTTTTTPSTSPQKAVLSAIADVAKTTAAVGKPPVSFADALKLAAKDPNIVSKYSDMAKLDKAGFLQQLQLMQTQYSNQAQSYRQQFENDRKALAEQQAAAGTAYSGFRSQAQAQLAQTEGGIISSSRAQQQNALNQLTSAYEAKYGTGATPKASITELNPLAGDTSISGLDQTLGGNTTITGQKIAGVTGSVGPAKQQDINQQALYNYNTALMPKV